MTKKTQNSARIDKKASETALFAAIHRFIANQEEKSSFKGPDNLSKIFLPPVPRFFLSLKYFRNKIRLKLHKKVPGTYEYMTARTRHFDELFRKALNENIPQLVLLGSGYDTRAIRFKDHIKDTKIFEVDTSIIQVQKKKMLEKTKINIPDQLTQVSINFNKESIEDILPKAGYNPALQSCFLWEGVTYYLTEEAIKKTLSFIKNSSGPDSRLAFDYFYKDVISGDTDLYGAREIQMEVRKSGEPFLFGLDPGEINLFLQENGFGILSHYSPEEFEKLYLYDDLGEYYGRMYGFAGNVIASTMS